MKKDCWRDRESRICVKKLYAKQMIEEDIEMDFTMLQDNLRLSLFLGLKKRFMAVLFTINNMVRATRIEKTSA